MSAFKDISGQRFGRLVAIRYDQGRWLCQCDCGNQTRSLPYHLRRGKARSCGCTRAENFRYDQTTHGHTHSSTYKTWLSMRGRCRDKNRQNYGAIGVKVCPEWERSFQAFLADMGERPAGKTIDRWPDPAGNYEPGNCRWATPREQTLNRRPLEGAAPGQRGSLVR